jgi:hypothetical protein
VTAQRHRASSHFGDDKASTIKRSLSVVGTMDA